MREDIQTAFNNLDKDGQKPFKGWMGGGARSVLENELPQALTTDETVMLVRHAAEGSFDDDRGVYGVFALTDRRILFLGQNGGGGELRYEYVANVTARKRSSTAEVFVRLTNGAEVTYCFLAQKRAVEEVPARILQLKQSAPVPDTAHASEPASGIADELEKLASLRDRGILSSEEFEARKGKLLAE